MRDMDKHHEKRKVGYYDFGKSMLKSTISTLHRSIRWIETNVKIIMCTGRSSKRFDRSTIQTRGAKSAHGIHICPTARGCRYESSSERRLILIIAYMLHFVLESMVAPQIVDHQWPPSVPCSLSPNSILASQRQSEQYEL